MFCWSWHPVIVPQSLSRSSLWAASCRWPASPTKRTRTEIPPCKTASAILAYTAGLPECQGTVTMATKQPSTMEWRSTGRTRSTCDARRVYRFKWCAKRRGGAQSPAWKPGQGHICVQDDFHCWTQFIRTSVFKSMRCYVQMSHQKLVSSSNTSCNPVGRRGVMRRHLSTKSVFLSSGIFACDTRSTENSLVSFLLNFYSAKKRSHQHFFKMKILHSLRSLGLSGPLFIDSTGDS